MKEDLNMYNEELVIAVLIWTLGYVLGECALSDSEGQLMVRSNTL